MRSEESGIRNGERGERAMNEVPERTTKPRGLMWFLGEWKWEKPIPAVLALVFLGDALWTTTGRMHVLIRDGAFHSALLCALGFYLSEMRYRLFPDVRND
jgi:hypothetical protein